MLWPILLTAGASAITTLVLAGCIYQLVILPALEKRLAQVAEEMETRVQHGVETAGQNLLPEFRANVRDGFLDAMAQWPASEFRNATRTGAEFVEEGLSSLFGRRKKE